MCTRCEGYGGAANTGCEPPPNEMVVTLTAYEAGMIVQALCVLSARTQFESYRQDLDGLADRVAHEAVSSDLVPLNP